MTDLSKLRELAEKATPGPWVEEPHTNAIISPEAEYADGTPAAVAETVYMAEDRAYLAAVSPDSILALLKRLDVAEREREEARAECRTLRGERNTFEDDLAKALDRLEVAEREIEACIEDRNWVLLRAEAAEAKIAAVEALHQPWEETGKCRECSAALFSIHSVRWPCPTVRALQ